jgi:cytochrome b6-f complex iron-sulfur subunit
MNPNESEPMSRRGFFEWLVGLGTAAIAIFYGGTAIAMLKPPPVRTAKWQNLGPVEKFPVESPTLAVYTGEGFTDGVFVVRHKQGDPTVFDFHCAHLECPVRWIGAANEFACPCHGSTYNILGQHTGGPAPHGLWYHTRQVRGGDLWVAGEHGHAGNADA